MNIEDIFVKITWSIDKKRGNYRPHLKYTITLEAYEKELAVHTVNILSTIPKITNSHENYCLHGCNEREKTWQATDFHRISSPYYRDGVVSGYIRLPFRENATYPEIAESFTLLQKEYEKIVQAAYGSLPLQETGEIDTSDETKRIIAAHIASRKMLAFCSN